MRLLNVRTLKLEWFHSAELAPSYAILSHRWEDEEVLFEDVEERPEAQKLRSLQTKLEETERRLDALSCKFEGATQPKDPSSNTTDASGFANLELRDQTSSTRTPSEDLAHVYDSQQKKPKGWAKVLGSCKIAKEVGLSYIWIDTCCIDKSSSSELSESINSMFAWYRFSSLCIAYLSEVTREWTSVVRCLRASAWFDRGWTLQELIAPKDIWFYKGDWSFLGIRSELVPELHKITRIQEEILEWNGLEKLHSISVAARMSWAARRVTTRSEDSAYCLLGIFGINMPIMYGEGEQNAFFRLQTMILQTNTDHSIFCWEARALSRSERSRIFGPNHDNVALLAPSPVCFKNQAMVGFMDPAAEQPAHQIQYAPQSSNSMSVYLSMRKLGPDAKLYTKNENRFEAILGSFYSTDNKTKRVASIILLCTSPGKYRRLVINQRRTRQDVDVSDFQEKSRSLLAWSITQIFIDSPRLNLPPSSVGFFIKSTCLQASLNCTTTLRSGLEIGGFWKTKLRGYYFRPEYLDDDPDDGPNWGSLKISVKATENLSGENVYTAIFQESSTLDSRPDFGALAFTVRNVSNREICGVILFIQFDRRFAVSVTYDLKETDFKEGAFFDRELDLDLEGRDDPAFSGHRSMRDSLVSFKLRDGTHMFCGVETVDKYKAEIKVGILQ